MARDSTLYLSEDTIAAVSTGLGGALALVRLSGPKVLEIAEKLTRTETQWVARQARLITCYSIDGKKLDEGILVYFRGPQSFTGEDVVELSLHGSPYTVSKILEQIYRLGARPAERGEFSFRAVRNGKLTVPQAQGIADLIAARSGAAANLAIERMGGLQNRMIEDLRRRLEHVLMMSEVAIDFSDQDVEELQLEQLRSLVFEVQQDLERLSDSYQRGLRINEGISVAIVGAPNVGKSSLFNAIVGEDRSIVTEIAGTTRDVVRETFTLENKRGSWLFRFQDTAGIRDSTDRVENLGIERSKKAVEESDIVLLCIDGHESDEVLYGWESISKGERAVVAVGTKGDLLTSQGERARLTEKINQVLGRKLCWTSSVTGDGLSALTAELLSFAERYAARGESEWVLTEGEQRAAIDQARAFLAETSTLSEVDLFAGAIRQALHVLEPLLGTTVPDDILGKIFAQFCIGK